MVGRRGKERGAITQYNMANLQKTSQESGGLSIFVAEGKEMLGRVGSTKKTG